VGQSRVKGSRRPCRPHRRSKPRLPVYGAIDLGTNNCRMLMARPTVDGFRVVGSFSRIVRLGEGLTTTGLLDDGAIERTIEALGICAERMRDRATSRIRGVATEACRVALNGEAFLDRVKAETGLHLETISANEEADLTLAGCSALLDRQRPRAVVFDIGGGSTEVMWTGCSKDGKTKVLDMLSLPYGVVSLAEQYGGGFLTGPGYEKIAERVTNDLASFDARNGITGQVSGDNVQMLGTSGTVTTVAAFHLGLTRYERARVDGIAVDRERIAEVCQRLAAMDYNTRVDHSCIGPQRADLVVVGCAVLEAICRLWPVNSVRVADRGIREGLLTGMMAEEIVQERNS
jgi:exopolyphosphatase / guanosine-5'-triphosphate,3'-diphosphate pyrophosphatase